MKRMRYIRYLSIHQKPFIAKPREFNNINCLTDLFILYPNK